MVAYSAVKASNAQIRSTLPPSPTALFVGSTAGIGYEAMRAFVANFQLPNIYFIGRTQSTGDKIIEEMKQVNDKAKYVFIPGDFTLLHEVERVSKIVVEKVGSTGLDYVCLSPGFLDFSGRHGTLFSLPFPYLDIPLTSLTRNKRRPRQAPHNPLLRPRLLPAHPLQHPPPLLPPQTRPPRTSRRHRKQDRLLGHGAQKV